MWDSAGGWLAPMYCRVVTAELLAEPQNRRVGTQKMPQGQEKVQNHHPVSSTCSPWVKLPSPCEPWLVCFAAPPPAASRSRAVRSAGAWMELETPPGGAAPLPVCVGDLHEVSFCRGFVPGRRWRGCQGKWPRFLQRKSSLLSGQAEGRLAPGQVSLL